MLLLRVVVVVVVVGDGCEVGILKDVAWVVVMEVGSGRVHGGGSYGGSRMLRILVRWGVMVRKMVTA